MYKLPSNIVADRSCGAAVVGSSGDCGRSTSTNLVVGGETVVSKATAVGRTFSCCGSCSGSSPASV